MGKDAKMHAEYADWVYKQFFSKVYWSESIL